MSAIEAPIGGTPGQARTLRIDGLSFHVTEYGGIETAPPVLCLHGGMAHSRFFDLLAPLLKAFSRPFALDRRGHGDSEWAEPSQYGMLRDVEDIEAACARLDPGPWVLLGHSQGGILSIPLAQRARIPLAGLVLLDIPFDPMSPSLRTTGARLRRIPQIRYPTKEAAIRGFRPYPLPHRVSDEVVRYLAEHSFREDGDGKYISKFHWARMRRTREADADLLGEFPERFRSIELPVLAVRGGASSILSAAEHLEMTARFPRGDASVIADVTHSLHLEKPHEVASAIRAFFETLHPEG